ncbi:copper resistance CopC family protein [Arthrobacter sp. TMN-49]
MTPQPRLRRTLVAVAAALLIVLGSSTAALAHDAVLETSPANGSTVATVPAKIQISLSNSPAVIGSQVLVLDEAGDNWAQGEVDVLDKVAAQGVRPGAPAGKYTVQWRLVSSDSHPIEGKFSFTATAAATTAGQGVGAGPMQSVQAPTEAGAEPVQDSGAVPWSVFALIGVLIVVVVAMVVVARRRLASEE